MSLHKIAFALALGVAAAVATMYAPTADARVVVGVAVAAPWYAPPAPIVETVAVARPGQVWIPGYWRWTGYRYVWVGGYWGPVRVGYRYVGPRWVGCGPHWCFRAGYWVR